MNYEELRRKANEHWLSLMEGDVPLISVGTALCGHASGGFRVLKKIRQHLSANSVAATVQEVGCIGLCYAETLVDIKRPGSSRLFLKNVRPDEIESILGSYLVEGNIPTDKVLGYRGEHGPIGNEKCIDDLPGMALQNRIALRNAGTIAPDDILQYIASGGYEGLSKALSIMTPNDVIEEIKKSGLRGRGGAAFPTGVKWSFLVGAPGPKKYILCNCEEGDPGAYNDKGILESDPHTLLEGLLIAGYATGASNGIVFIRHGHDGPIDRTERAIEQAYESGVIGKNILGSDFSFDIEVALTGESYVAGEETALMEAIEGKRSMPRYRPPFPAAYGVWGKPSNINNVKSLSYVPEIISKGAEWFSSIGVNKSTGTAIVCLSGNINLPGLYEVPMGMTLGQVIDDLGGGVSDNSALKMLQTGGPLGGVLGPDSRNIHIDFDEMRDAGAIFGSGGIIVGNSKVCAVDLTRVLVAFCQYESCGKCFPCRLGMEHLLEIVERVANCQSIPGDMDLLQEVGTTMESSSLCGHGQLGFGPIRSAMAHFEEDFRAHIEDEKCPTGSCSISRITPKNTRPYARDYVPGEYYVRPS